MRDKLPGFLKQAMNPGICIFTFIFKAAGILSYLLMNLFVDNLVLTYIMVIIFAAFDFYVVKNITGR